MQRELCREVDRIFLFSLAVSPQKLEYPFVLYCSGYKPHQYVVIHLVEELLKIKINHYTIARTDMLLRASYRLMG